MTAASIRTDQERGVLSEAEMEDVLMALARGQGGPFTEEEWIAALRWAELARVSGCALEMALCGELYLRVRDGEVYLVHPRQVGEAAG